MGYYSDPTAQKALGEIGREFSRLERKAKRLKALLKSGAISETELEESSKQFRGLYRHVLTNVLEADDEK